MFTTTMEMTLPETDWSLVVQSSRLPFVKTKMYFAPFGGTKGYPVTLEQITHITDNGMDSFAAMAYLRSLRSDV
jgi:hypothetical protein